MSLIPRLLSLVTSAKSVQASVEQAKGSVTALRTMTQDVQAAAVERDWQKACQGHAAAQHDMGERLLEGRGVPRDYAAATDWFRLAAEQGYAPAQCNWGMMLFVGRGIPPDRVEAYKWIALSAQQGHEKAVEALKTATQRMLPEEIRDGQQKAAAFVPKPNVCSSTSTQQR